MPSEDQARSVIPYRVLAVAWAALILLTLATVAVSRGRLLAGLSGAGSLAIAGLKAGIILLVFMDVRREPAVIRVAFAVAVAALALVLGLIFSDVLLRS
jgi:cytochrome c oxidase subunit IV